MCVQSISDASLVWCLSLSTTHTETREIKSNLAESACSTPCVTKHSTETRPCVKFDLFLLQETSSVCRTLHTRCVLFLLRRHNAPSWLFTSVLFCLFQPTDELRMKFDSCFYPNWWNKTFFRNVYDFLPVFDTLITPHTIILFRSSQKFCIYLLLCRSLSKENHNSLSLLLIFN